MQLPLVEAGAQRRHETSVEPDAERRLEVVLGVGAEGDVRLGLGDARDLVQAVVADRLNKVEGVTETETHIAFRTYSKHDLESAFSIGLD